MQQLTIRMPDEDLYRIEKIAKSTGLKKSDITRMAIKKFIANEIRNRPIRIDYDSDRYEGIDNIIIKIKSNDYEMNLSYNDKFIEIVKK